MRHVLGLLATVLIGLVSLGIGVYEVVDAFDDDEPTTFPVAFPTPTPTPDALAATPAPIDAAAAEELPAAVG